MLLNLQLTFESLVVGPHNAEAVGLARLAIQRAGQGGWLLRIHGGRGLGKTHLLHAIGNEIMDAHPSRKIAIGSSEYFTNALAAVVDADEELSFWTTYFDQADILLLDDVDALSVTHPGAERLRQAVCWFRTQGRPIVAISRGSLLKDPERAPTFGPCNLPRSEALITTAPLGVCVDIAKRCAIRFQLNLPPERVEHCARMGNGNPAEVIGRVIREGRGAA